MFNRPERPSGTRRRRLGAVTALILSSSLWLVPAAAAQEPAGAAGAAGQAEAAGAAAQSEAAAERASARVEEPARTAGLAAEILASYEVLPAREGLVLRPRTAGSGVLSIEIADGEVAIDGETASESEIRKRLGGEAEAVLRLAELDPEEARGLFQLGGAGAFPREAPQPPPAPGSPRPPRPPGVQVGERVSILSNSEVRAGEVAEQAVAVGGSVTVDGVVDQDAVAVGGSARVNGTVGGDVVAVGGSVYLGPEAVVGGDLVCVGGRIHQAEGAKVGGQPIEVAATGILLSGARGWEGWSGHPGGGWFRFDEAWDVITDVIGFAVLLLLVWLVILVAQRPVERIEQLAATDPWRAALAGMLAWILFVPLLVLVAAVLLISIIGIPLLILMPVVVMLFLVGLLLGYSGVAIAVGRWLERRFAWRFANAFVLAFVGLLAIKLWTIAADVLDIVAGPVPLIAGVTMVFGVLVRFAALTVGLGAVVLTRFGAGPRQAPAAPVPTSPPPAPEFES